MPRRSARIRGEAPKSIVITSEWKYFGKNVAMRGIQYASRGDVVEHDSMIYDPKKNAVGPQFIFTETGAGGLIHGVATAVDGLQFPILRCPGHVFVPRSQLGDPTRHRRRTKTMKAAAADAASAVLNRLLFTCFVLLLLLFSLF